MDGGRTFVSYRINQEPFACDPKTFFGDYLGVSAYGGRAVVAYMHFDGGDKLAVSAALFRFKPGTQELSKEPREDVKSTEPHGVRLLSSSSGAEYRRTSIPFVHLRVEQ